jgi:hypothetical protein
MGRYFRSGLFSRATAAAIAALAAGAFARAEEVRLAISAEPMAPAVAPLFLGLSYETRAALPEGGHYYFDAQDRSLVDLFRTLGLRSLRIGGNAVDDPRVPVPREADLDALFAFARAAGVKVIYSFRLKQGDPALAAHLAAYLAAHYAEQIDSFCIGNEPDHYLKTYPEFLAAFRPQYAAVVGAAPNVRLEGPAGADWSYLLDFAREYVPQGHVAMVSSHSYPLGAGREAEKDPAAALRRFLGPEVRREYEKIYRDTCLPLARLGIPFRMDETNSCWDGGARGSSDSYASALWALEYLNWWAAHGIVGLNFHTGDTVNGFPPMAANYAAFVHEGAERQLAMRPLAYALLAFSQGAHGSPLPVRVEGAGESVLTAFAYREGPNFAVLVLNKTAGVAGRSVELTLKLPGARRRGHWDRLDLVQAQADLAAREGVSVGSAAIGPDGHWTGGWRKLDNRGSGLNATVEPASAAWFRFVTGSQE